MITGKVSNYVIHFSFNLSLNYHIFRIFGSRFISYHGIQQPELFMQLSLFYVTLTHI